MKYSCIYCQVWNRRWCLYGLGRLHLTYCWRPYLQYRCWKGRMPVKVKCCYCITVFFHYFFYLHPCTYRENDHNFFNFNLTVQNTTYLPTNSLVLTQLSQQIKALCLWLAPRSVRAENPEPPETAKWAAFMEQETTPGRQLLMHMCDLSSFLPGEQKL